jgi:hypothetical protein
MSVPPTSPTAVTTPYRTDGLVSRTSNSAHTTPTPASNASVMSSHRSVWTTLSTSRTARLRIDSVTSTGTLDALEGGSVDGSDLCQSNIHTSLVTTLGH